MIILLDNKVESTTISVAQYQQFMDLLIKQSNAPSNAHDHSSDYALLAGKICLMAESIGKTGWLIDSGATDHICSDLNLFHNYKPVTGTNEFIIVPDGRQVAILHIGYIIFNDHMVLHNVLHIPHFHYNLISVQRLCKDMHCSVVFNGHECLLQDHLQKEKLLLIGKLHEGLYSTSGLNNSSSSISVFLSIKEDISIWYLTLGHVPFSKLKLILELSSIQNSSTNLICQICPLARKTKMFFLIVVLKQQLLLKFFKLICRGLIRSNHTLDVISFLP